MRGAAQVPGVRGGQRTAAPESSFKPGAARPRRHRHLSLSPLVWWSRRGCACCCGRSPASASLTRACPMFSGCKPTPTPWESFRSDRQSIGGVSLRVMGSDYRSSARRWTCELVARVYSVSVCFKPSHPRPPFCLSHPGVPTPEQSICLQHTPSTPIIVRRQQECTGQTPTRSRRPCTQPSAPPLP